MGTLAAVLAGKKIPAPKPDYWADVEGDIEKVGEILKITAIRVRYHLRITEDKVQDAKECFLNYIQLCPAAQTVIGCIKIEDDLCFDEKD
jgi:organic hydroperoxide reductase OsmC/OhrA